MVMNGTVAVTGAGVQPEKTLEACKWPPIRNTERLHTLSVAWAAWWHVDLTNFIRLAVAFFIVMAKVFDMFQSERLEAFYKIDRVLPLDQ